jgi:uncharacterized membrane protein
VVVEPVRVPDDAMAKRRAELRGAFGADAFGRRAEAIARFFGTPQYILGQTVVVIIWILVNALAVALRWDPYPFILLNLAFSTQAAYAAPLILLAQTRQADRDKAHGELVESHREEQAQMELKLLEQLEGLNEDMDRLLRREGASGD